MFDFLNLIDFFKIKPHFFWNWHYNYQGTFFGEILNTETIH